MIFVDEVHSLTADASFADSTFTVERFIHHTLRKNPKCDVVVMSGTPASTDWLFSKEHWGTEYTSIDLYDQCVHLVPDKVHLFTRAGIAERIFYLWKQDKRSIYFVNSVNGMAKLITELKQLGIPECDMGIAFTESDNAGKLPPDLVRGREAIRQYLVSESRLPTAVKIFIIPSTHQENPHSSYFLFASEFRIGDNSLTPERQLYVLPVLKEIHTYCSICVFRLQAQLQTDIHRLFHASTIFVP